MAVFAYIGVSDTKADSQSYKTNVIKPQAVTNVEEIDHLVETFYGSSGVFGLDEMIDKLALEVYPEDKVSAFLDPKFGLGAIITITRATPVKVVDAGKEVTYRTWKTSYKDFLEEKGLGIGEKDMIEPSLDSQLSYNSELKITRVAETEAKGAESLPYKTIVKEDPNLEKGVTKVEQPGKEGKKELTYAVRRENGEEVSRELVGRDIVREPVDKVIIKGTKVVSYGEGTATWYDWIGGMTAASNSLSYGTMVRVTNMANGKSVEVKIVDHGIKGGAVIDLSDTAFSQIASLSQGKIQVRLEKP